jgi:hypothetical protein
VILVVRTMRARARTRARPRSRRPQISNSHLEPDDPQDRQSEREPLARHPGDDGTSQAARSSAGQCRLYVGQFTWRLPHLLWARAKASIARYGVSTGDPVPQLHLVRTTEDLTISVADASPLARLALRRGRGTIRSRTSATRAHHLLCGSD